MIIFSLHNPPIVREPERVVVPVDGKQIVIEPLAAGAIHIQVSRAGEQAWGSYVRVEPSKRPAFTVRETPSEVQVATKQMRVVLNRRTGALEFRTPAGKTFLAEKPGTRTIEVNPVGGQNLYRVGQTFACPKDEKLFGLGQFQNGLWNWRGIPLELRQLNTQIAVPVLFSSRNYGLLWENASRTDFNPADIAIPLAGVRGGGEGPTATEGLGARRPASLSIVEGIFTPTVTGTYAFAVRDGDRRDELTLSVDGKPLNSLVNLWTPRGLEGRLELKAGKPIKLAVRGGGKAVKLLARRIDDTTTFLSDYGRGIDYTVFHGPQPDDAIAAYRQVTGKAPLFPKWAFGLWQCRERYSSQDEILRTAAEFRRREIPMDLIVQDWQYWGRHGWGSYAWDESAYPDPKAMINGLHAMDVRFMISVWCNPSSVTQTELKAAGAWANGWVDVFSEKGRSIRWKGINDAFFSKGTDAWWGDATEPGDPGTDWLGATTSAGPGDAITSAYPLLASRGLYEGQRATSEEKRVCNLTRSAFAGSQRYAAASWSGDINGTWDGFRRQIPAGLNFSLTGIPYWTTDAAGFFHPRDQYTSPDYNELLSRWFAWSTFCPILRIHGYQSRTEMWNYLPETQSLLLGFDRLRYRMLPYNYSVAAEVWRDDTSFMRPLGTAFPGDAKSWDVAGSYLFGPSLLVSPVTTPGVTEWKVYLPPTRGGWIDFWTGEKFSGGREAAVKTPLDRIPLFVKAGSILPLGPVVQNVGQAAGSPLEIRVYPGADGRFMLYDDAGDGYGYERGAKSEIGLSWNDSKRTLTLGERKGTFPGMAATRKLRVVLVGKDHGVGAKEVEGDHTVSYTGRAVEIRM